MGIRNQVLDSCESTNDLAKKLGEEGSPHGSWISARTQTQGRGRMGRSWMSEDGNLFFSMVLRPNPSFPISATPLAVALALFESIQEIKSTEKLSIKWPNDLVIDSGKEIQKVAGILCEGVGSARSSFIVAGLGVNCKIAPMTDQPTAALQISADHLREKMIQHLPRLFDRPWSLQRTAYESCALLKKGVQVSWYSVQEPERVTSGIVESYGDFGELCVRRNDGVVQRLYSEEVKVRKSAHLA